MGCKIVAALDTEDDLVGIFGVLGKVVLKEVERVGGWRAVMDALVG
jgi:hypothetical protein